jgi:excisionase family DNA binding protein
MDKTKEYNDYKVNFERLLKPMEVAQILNISRSFAYQLLQSGQIPTVKMGKTYRVRPQDLAEFIEKNTQ